MIAISIDDTHLTPFLKRVFDTKGFIRQSTSILGFVCGNPVLLEISIDMTFTIYEPSERSYFALYDRTNRAIGYLPKAHIKGTPNSKITIKFEN